MKWTPYEEFTPQHKLKDLLLDIEVIEGDLKGRRLVIPVTCDFKTKELVVMYNGSNLSEMFKRHKILYYSVFPAPNLDNGTLMKPMEN